MGEAQHETRSIFLQALALEDAEERVRYLDEACRDRVELRQRIEALLRAHAEAGGFLRGDAGDDECNPPEARVGEGPGTVIGRYKLLEKIGEGSFGVVFMAEQLEPVRRRVALKIVKPGMDTKEVIARFEAERQALALMDHPNIAHVFDGGATESGRPYFVMELVLGVPVTDFCDANGLTPHERLELFQEVCEAVQHAHQKGVIHRDLKPSNILVTLHDGRPVPKVIDFGTAKALQQRLTERTLFTGYGKFIGTPQYMSPEQAELSGLDVDTRADIYALGVLLYELLTGTTPFEAGRLRAAAFEEMLRIIREEEPPKPSTRVTTLGERATEIAKHRQVDPALLRRTLRGDLDWIAMKSLEKDRTRRYGTAGALAEDIRRHLTHEPVLASPPGAVYRMRKFIRRHRMGVAFAVSVTIAMLAGLLVSLIGFTRAQHERDRALQAEKKSEQERNHAEFLAAEAVMAEGQAKLEAGDNRGLLDMVKAFDVARHNPELQATIGRRWSTWHSHWRQRTIAVLPLDGTPSPDYLQYVTIKPWFPSNTSEVAYLCDISTGARSAGPLVHDSIAVACAFSPDDRLLATLTQKGVIHLWERQTGAPERPPCSTGIQSLKALAFSPDGRFLAAFGLTNSRGSAKVAVLRLDRPAEPVQVLDHRYPVGGARFSPDSEWLAVQAKPDIQLWRTSDFQPAGQPLATTMAARCEFSPDSRLMAYNRGEPGGGFSLLDVRSRRIERILPKPPNVSNASFSHDGHRLATTDFSGNIEIWDLESGGGPFAVSGIEVRGYGDLAFNRDDSLLAAGDLEGTVHVIRARDGKQLDTLAARPPAKTAFLSNDVLVAQGARMGLFWDLAAAPLPGEPLAHDGAARSLAFDQSGDRLAIGGEGELRLWAMRPSPALERVVKLPGRVTALAYSDKESRFVAFTDDGSTTLVDGDTGQATLRSNCGRGHGMSAALSPDGGTLALFRYEELLAVNTGTGAFQFLNDGGGVRSIGFNAASTVMLVGTAGWATFPYVLTKGPKLAPGSGWELRGWIEGVALQPGGRSFAVAVWGTTLHLCEWGPPRRIVSTRKTAVTADSLRFSVDGSLLAVSGALQDGGHAVELWHVEPERGLIASGITLRSEFPVWSMAFSPDNRTLVVGCLGTTRLWRLPAGPGDLEDIRSNTWSTVGFGSSAQGQPVPVARPPADAAQFRARLTQDRLTSLPPMDAALQLPPTEALAAMEKLAEQYPDVRVYRIAAGWLQAGFVNAAAEKGDWAGAAANATAALRSGNDIPDVFYLNALACLAAGDQAGYRATCRKMVDRHASSSDPLVTKWVAWAVSLVPGALEDYEPLIAQLRRSTPRAGGRHGPAFRFYLGALLARAGRYKEAKAELDVVARHLKEAGAFVEFTPVYHKFLLAICQARLGQTEAARQNCEAARSDADRSATSWSRQLTIRLLQEEALSLLNTPAPRPSP